MSSTSWPKGLIGTNNVDTNSRLCMSSAVAGYKQTLGADAPPCSYEDILQARVIFIAGANPAVAHPIIFRYIEDARAANPELKIIVADPRRSESAEIADLHLAIKPGTDIALFNGMLQRADRRRPGRSRLCRCAYHRFRGARRDRRKSIRRPSVPKSAASPQRISFKAARWFGRSGGFAVAVLPGAEPVGARHPQQCRDHPPASGDRTDRQAGGRPVFADRSAECDGRARSRWTIQPAVGPPRSGESGTPGRNGALLGRALRAEQAGQVCGSTCSKA